jgi:glutamate-1-semialdehyde 2,1-aminomutase
MDQRFAISNYPDTKKIINQLDELIKKPIYTVKPEALKAYVDNYFEKKCSKSKEMIEKAKDIIPGGVQHNLAFNHPFPLVFTKAEGPYLYDIDGNKYYDFLQAGAQQYWAATLLKSEKRYLNC